ncbi:MAG: penicillin-binding protein 2 [Gammaproteobacteria bacterium]
MARRITLKNLRIETLIFRERAILSAILVAGTFILLLVRLYDLQITNYSHYQTLSNDNRVRVLPVAPTRGLILDRNGEILADNTPNYQLVITPSQVKNMPELIASLAEFIDIKEHELTRFEKTLKRQQAFQQTPLKFKLTEEEVAKFAVNQHRYPGVEIAAHSTRYYPQKNSFAHALGYVGRINEKELGKLDKQKYQGTSHIGKVGIEKRYENELHGEVGYKHVEINAQGRSLRVLKTQPSTPGMDIQLSLVARLQEVAQEALGEENGAIVAIDPNNGDVLAFVSQPNYDPNLFVNGIGQLAYSALRDNKHRPLFNRALIGQYPPGSTVKPIVALAGLQYGVTWPEKTMYAGPFFQLPGKARKYRDWKKGGHGIVNMDSAIAQSCDVYFYELGDELGINRMHEFLIQFGLGSVTKLDTVGEVKGLMPSPEWKRSARGQPWYPGETIITSIGQGYMLTTPLQLAVMTAYIANHGSMYQPRFVRATRMAGTFKFEDKQPIPMPQVNVKNESYWQAIEKAMISVVHEPNGTARSIGLDANYKIAGKTGTAQVFGIAQDEEYDKETTPKHLQDHALFVAYAPVENPVIALAVVVENGGSGSGTAAPVARKILDAYLIDENKLEGKQVVSR